MQQKKFEQVRALIRQEIGAKAPEPATVVLVEGSYAVVQLVGDSNYIRRVVVPEGIEAGDQVMVQRGGRWPTIVSAPTSAIASTGVVVGSASSGGSVGGAPPEHDHEEYLTATEGNLLYATIGHNHNGVYALVGHDHAGIYSPVGHDHAGIYQPVGNYAAASHAHSGADITSGSVGIDYLPTPASGSASASQVVRGNDPRLSDARTPTAHSHATTDVTGFAEAVDDRVAALIVAGSNITATYNDGANTLTLAVTGLALSGHTHDHGDLTGLGDDDHSIYHTDARGDARYYTKSQTYTQTEINAAFSSHTNASDPHPGYLTAAEGAALITTHENASDPHPGYMTAAEGTALINTHKAEGDPHPGYLTTAEGNAAYATTGHNHNTAYVQQASNITSTDTWYRNGFFSLPISSSTDDGMVGIHDRNQLINAAYRGSITVSITGAGIFTNTQANLNTLVDGMGNYLQFTGTDATTTQIQILIDNGSNLQPYGSSRWQPFLQYRRATTSVNPDSSYYKNILVEASADNVTWNTVAGWSTTDVASGQFIPGMWLGTNAVFAASVVRYVRFTLTDRVTGTTNTDRVWITELGMRHRGSPFAPQYADAVNPAIYGTATVSGTLNATTLQQGGTAISTLFAAAVHSHPTLAPLASPTFTGVVTAPDVTVTNAITSQNRKVSTAAPPVAADVTVSGTTTETNLISQDVGALVVGRTYRVVVKAKITGNASSGVPSHSFLFKLKYGNTTLQGAPTMDYTGLTNHIVHYEQLVTVRATGVSGVIQNALTFHNFKAGMASNITLVDLTQTTLDTTAGGNLTVTGTWSNGSVSNVAIVQLAFIEVLG